MKTAGIDIGTTTISAVVLEDRQLLTSTTRKNGAFIPSAVPNAREQDVSAITQTALSAVQDLLTQYPDIAAIGVTGQMHGILYVNARGEAVSPLYTWQDGRGDAPCSKSGCGESWAQYLTRTTGCFAATGYGLVTHACNLAAELVPETAVTCCTIGDYIAMRLSGQTAPQLDASNAASLGFFDAEHGVFDAAALQKAGIDPDFLPLLAQKPVIGRYRGRAAVCAAIGDNQASFLRSVRDKTAEMLVNVGTGSQFSVFAPQYMQADGLETRPMPGGGYLLAGASLCGGRAYALLEQFFRDAAHMVGAEVPNCYDAMAHLLAQQPRPQDVPAVCTLFQGTRADSSLTGSITGLTAHNFTPLHLIWGLMDGMAHELHQMYAAYLHAGGTAKRLIGSGNGLRQNPYLQQCFENIFACPLTLSDGREEAAAGAAQFAAEQFRA